MTSDVKDENERQNLISLCAEYLGEEWSNNKELLRTGIANKTYRCFMNNLMCTRNGNNDVILRLYGSGISGNDNKFKINTEAAEALVMQMLYKIGMAPKLLAVFPGGRIEEYIPSKPATTEDLSAIETCKAVIRKLAKFHSLSMPLSKNPNIIVDHLNKLMQSVTVTEKLFENLSEDELSARQTLFNFPFESEFKWIKEILPKVGHKVILSHNDMNPNNILLKNNASSFDDSILLIDYERSTYFYRGYDIASFLRLKSAKLQMEGSKFNFHIENIDNSIRDHIITEYLKESRKLNERDFDSKFDTLERLIMEVDFFCLFFDVYGVGMFQWMLCVSQIGIPLEMIVKIIETYEERKRCTLSKYGDPIHWK